MIDDILGRYLNEVNALTGTLDKLLDQLAGIDDDKKYNRVLNKAKKEFTKTHIKDVDFHGYWDRYLTTKKG